MVVRELGLSTATPKRGAPTWLPAAVAAGDDPSASCWGSDPPDDANTLTAAPTFRRPSNPGGRPAAEGSVRAAIPPAWADAADPARLRRDAAAVRDRLALPLLLRAACAFWGKDQHRLDILAGLA